MKNLLFALASATALLAARPASAATDYYQIQGNSCVSITNGLASQYSQFGANAGNTAIDVTCPVTLPLKSYTSAYIQIWGYNRSYSDQVSCKISSTDAFGGHFVSKSATLANNSSVVQVGQANLTLTPSFGNNYAYVTCHLPAQTGSGISHLSSFYLGMSY